MKEKLLTRKNFFTLTGIGGLGFLVFKHTPMKRFFTKNNGNTPVIEINPLAVKRDNRGKLNG
ncbi:MAG: hypothetical protein HYV28_12930 [Ignavibacteriales bacterium]|nr:hypothetical protein [Ignavibacteriales bacterium]